MFNEIYAFILNLESADQSVLFDKIKTLAPTLLFQGVFFLLITSILMIN